MYYLNNNQVTTLQVTILHEDLETGNKYTYSSSLLQLSRNILPVICTSNACTPIMYTAL